MNKFTSEDFKAKFQKGSISGEILVSDLVTFHSKTLKSFSEKDISETKISSSLQIRNYVEIFTGLIDKILSQISVQHFGDLQIFNSIVINTFHTLLHILESKLLSAEYWNLVEELQN